MKKLFILLSFSFLATTIVAQIQNYDNGIAHKFEFRADAGGATGTKSDQSLILDLGLGYNFTSNWYFGVASGIYPKFGVVDFGNPDFYIPIMADLSCRFNESNNEKWSYMCSFRAGGLFISKKDVTLEDGVTYKYRDYAVGEIAPGFIYRIKRNIDFRFSLGYKLAIPKGDGMNPRRNTTEHLFECKIGFAFRGKPKSGTRQEIHIQELEDANAKQRAKLEEIKEQEAKANAEAEQKAAEDRARRKAEREKALNPIQY